VRLDDAKANLSLASGSARWFKRVSIIIANGEEVGALVPGDPNERVPQVDRAYLQSNIEGGEFFSWFYATITDGAYGKPWVFRSKDLRNWWLNRHYDRPGGVENGSPTAWLAQMKPIWFCELGVPSADKGANQPNVFYDPKSSESFLP
jgi:hypothetical protein